MSYIGNPIISTDFPKDTFSGNGSTTAFTMSIAPASVNAVIVVVSGITQDPSTYTISGTTLTFSAAPPSGTSNISVRHLGVAGIPNVPSASSVLTTSIADSNVTTAKIADANITPAKLSTGAPSWDSSSNLLVGSVSSPSGSGSVMAAGFVRGGTVSQSSGYENGNYTITTPATVYSFNKDQGGGGGSSSTVFNITGLPNTDGSWALIYVRSSNTVGGVNCTAQVQVNGTQVFSGGVQNTTKTAVFAVFKANGVWNAGAWATGASLTNVW